MPEPHADVFGDGLEDAETATIPSSGEEHEGLLGDGVKKFVPTNGPSSAIDPLESDDSSLCFRLSICSLAFLCVLCLCVASFLLGTRFETLKHQRVDLDSLDSLDSLQTKSKMPQERKDLWKDLGTTKIITTTTSSTTRFQGMAEQLTSLETMEKALACMRLTNPDVEAAYPSDAEEHFAEIFYNASKFVPMDWAPHKWAGYAGPWIENHWINVGKRYLAQRHKGTKLSDVFGPFIPIFVPWVDMAVKSKGYPGGLVKMLTESMRRNVLYITVSQHDSGIFEAVRNLKINREKDMPNLLVLSSGGNGHVPLPLLKQPEEPFPPTPMSSRRYFVSFIGSANMFNKGARKPMKAQTEKWAEKTKKEVLVHLGGLKNWREIMQNSTLTFVPRGFGRNSFRCTEVLQMGRVPIYVWNDIPWTFYPNLWDNEIIGFSAQVGKIEETLDHIAKDVSLEQLERMEEKILSMRDTHFTYEGVMDQISKFMTGRDGGSDLRCTVYPYSRSKKRPRLLRANRWWLQLQPRWLLNWGF